MHGALEIDGMKKVTWLSAGTDGIDGPTDAAGAIVDGSTIEKAREKGLDPEELIQENNSYTFHQQLGTLLKTGPTGNNMMDVVVVLLNDN
jgi:glycerate-2-kinase